MRVYESMEEKMDIKNVASVIEDLAGTNVKSSLDQLRSQIRGLAPTGTVSDAMGATIKETVASVVEASLIKGGSNPLAGIKAFRAMVAFLGPAVVSGGMTFLTEGLRSGVIKAVGPGAWVNTFINVATGMASGIGSSAVLEIARESDITPEAYADRVMGAPEIEKVAHEWTEAQKRWFACLMDYIELATVRNGQYSDVVFQSDIWQISEVIERILPMREAVKNRLPGMSAEDAQRITTLATGLERLYIRLQDGTPEQSERAQFARMREKYNEVWREYFREPVMMHIAPLRKDLPMPVRVWASIRQYLDGLVEEDVRKAGSASAWKMWLAQNVPLIVSGGAVVLAGGYTAWMLSPYLVVGVVSLPFLVLGLTGWPGWYGYGEAGMIPLTSELIRSALGMKAKAPHFDLAWYFAISSALTAIGAGIPMLAKWSEKAGRYAFAGTLAWAGGVMGLITPLGFATTPSTGWLVAIVGSMLAVSIGFVAILASFGLVSGKWTDNDGEAPVISTGSAKNVFLIATLLVVAGTVGVALDRADSEARSAIVTSNTPIVSRIAIAGGRPWCDHNVFAPEDCPPCVLETRTARDASPLLVDFHRRLSPTARRACIDHMCNLPDGHNVPICRER